MQIHENHYCSRACRDEGRKKEKVILTCKTCNKEYEVIPAHAERSVYCSKECFYEGKKTGKFKTCEFCGKEFWSFKSSEERSGDRFCSWECYVEFKKDPNLDPTSRKASFKTWAPLVKERDNFICQKCGSTENLHAHHILEWQDYPDERFNVDNGITLCSKCHIETHRQTLII